MKKLTYILTVILIGVNFASCANKEVVTTSKPSGEVLAQSQEKQSDKKEEMPIKNEAVAISTDSKPQENKPVQPEKTQEIKSKKIIVLDPGHASKANLEKEPLAPGSNELKIKDGGGAAGVVTRTPEYKVNMSVAMKLKTLLEEKGYSVVMTKTEVSKSLGNTERAEIWNKTNAALVLRLHADSSESSEVRGASMLVPAPINDNTKAIHDQSKKYGQTVLNTLVKEVGMANRGVVERNDMTGFNWSKVPVILVEMGFLSNREEDKLLSTEEYQDKIAKALAEGISSAVK